LREDKPVSAVSVRPTWGELPVVGSINTPPNIFHGIHRKAAPQSARYPGLSFVSTTRVLNHLLEATHLTRRPTLPTRCNPSRWASPNSSNATPCRSPPLKWLGATKSGTDHPVNSPFFPCHSGKPETCSATKHPFQERRCPPPLRAAQTRLGISSKLRL